MVILFIYLSSCLDLSIVACCIALLYAKEGVLSPEPRRAALRGIIEEADPSRESTSLELSPIGADSEPTAR